MNNVLRKIKLSAIISFAQENSLKLSIICHKKPSPVLKKTNSKILSYLMNFLLIVFFVMPIAANADVGGSGLSGITDFLKSTVHLLIFDCGYYIGILALAIQVYRWRAGYISLFEAFKWAIAITIIFLAPSLMSNAREAGLNSLP